jgi:hypothetical protein
VRQAKVVRGSAQQDSAMRNRTVAQGDRWAKELGGGIAPDAADS